MKEQSPEKSIKNYSKESNSKLTGEPKKTKSVKEAKFLSKIKDIKEIIKFIA